MKWKTEITVETRQLLIIRRRATLGWCPLCAAQATLLSAEEAAAVADFSLRTVFHLVETGRLHLCETAEGRGGICLNSLFDLTSKGA